jgi:hypothetical protein
MLMTGIELASWQKACNWTLEAQATDSALTIRGPSGQAKKQSEDRGRIPAHFRHGSGESDGKTLAMDGGHNSVRQQFQGQILVVHATGLLLLYA